MGALAGLIVLALATAITSLVIHRPPSAAPPEQTPSPSAAPAIEPPPLPVPAAPRGSPKPEKPKPLTLASAAPSAEPAAPRPALVEAAEADGTPIPTRDGRSAAAAPPVASSSPVAPTPESPSVLRARVVASTLNSVSDDRVRHVMSAAMPGIARCALEHLALRGPSRWTFRIGRMGGVEGLTADVTDQRARACVEASLQGFVAHMLMGAPEPREVTIQVITS
jgi:hypothetical protein